MRGDRRGFVLGTCGTRRVADGFGEIAQPKFGIARQRNVDACEFGELRGIAAEMDDRRPGRLERSANFFELDERRHPRVQ